MNDAQTIVGMMVQDGLDYHVINDDLMIGEFDGEYWLVDCSTESDMNNMPKIMRLR